MMKKVLFFAGLTAAVLSLVGCNKEADFFGHDGRKMQIVLTDVETRTVNDGLSTKWVDGDALNVFYAPAGTTDYSANCEFTVDDAASNHATGTAELSVGTYDWYLLYPYESHIATPANTKAGYLAIGSKSNETQTQKGLNSTAHLAGKNLPVWGVAKNVSVKAVPKVAMKHVASVVKVNVTNGLDKAINISNVAFTGTEDVVGTYYIDFSGETPAFTGSGKNYVSSTANLAVSDADALAAGETASFYLAIKPFTAPANGELAVKVIADAGSVEKTITLEKETEFRPGYIKTLNVTFSAAEDLPTLTIADIKDLVKGATSSNAASFEGKLAGAIVTFVSGRYAFIQDETAGIVFYNNTNPFAAGQKLEGVVSGSGYAYNGLKELTSLTVETITPDQTIPASVEMSLAELKADYDRYESVRVTVKGVTVPSAFTNRNTTMTDGDETLALRDQKGDLTITPGKYDIVGYPSYYNNPQFGVWAQEDIISAGEVNIFDVTPTQIDVAANATSAKINVAGNVAWTAEASDGASVSPASGNGEGTITVSFPANEDPDNAKEYTVFVRTEAEGVNDEFEVNITQAKADAAGITAVTVDFSEQGYENGTEVPSGTINGVTFAFDKGTSNNAPKYYTTGTAVRMYGGNAMTVSVAGKTLVSIELTFSSGEGTNEITTDVPTYAEPTWTGEAASVTFTIGGTSGHRRVKAVTVKYKDGGDVPPAATLESIAVSGQTTTFTVGDTFAFDGKVTASYSDGSTKDVTASAKVSNPDLSTAGTKEVTVSYTEGSVTKEAKYDITVNAAVVDGKTVSMTMTEYVAANGCKISSGSDATMYKTLQLNESVRMSTTGDDNCGSFWGNDTQEWRLYQNKKGNVTVSVAEGCELKSVKLTFSATNGGVLKDAGGATVASGDKKTVSGTSVTYTVENSGTATNGQIRITAVEVVYTGNGTTFPDTPPTVITTTITMPGSQAVYIGDSFSLNATSNVEGAPISYESEDPSIASVNASGVVTGVAEGVVKVYARITGVEGKYTDAERYCTVTVAKKPDVVSGTWEAKALSSIADGTQFILVSTNGDGESFAMGNDNGASMAPKAITVTVNDGTLTNPASNVIFVLNKTADGYVFKMEGGETWVYCYNSNNGLRVGNTETNVFTVDSESGYLVINDGTQNRYVGVYNKQDWRAYTSVNNNIKGQTFTFFVKK